MLQNLINVRIRYTDDGTYIVPFWLVQEFDILQKEIESYEANSTEWFDALNEHSFKFYKFKIDPNLENVELFMEDKALDKFFE